MNLNFMFDLQAVELAKKNIQAAANRGNLEAKKKTSFWHKEIHPYFADTCYGSSDEDETEEDKLARRMAKKARKKADREAKAILIAKAELNSLAVNKNMS